LSRQTVQDIDHFFIISDASARSIRSAGRVKQIVDTLHTKVHNIYLVVTKVMETGIDDLMGEIEATGLKMVGTIPYDPEVAEYDLKGKALYELSPKQVFKKLVLRVVSITDNQRFGAVSIRGSPYLLLRKLPFCRIVDNFLNNGGCTWPGHFCPRQVKITGR